MALFVKQDDVNAIKALIESKDITLAERKEVFKAKEGRDTTLDDDGVIAACAATDDDDDDLFVTNVKDAETNGISYTA